jgi:CBS domain-containing protein
LSQNPSIFTKIADILASKVSRVITIGPEQPLRQASILLVGYEIGGLVVQDPLGVLAGMIPERDLIHYAVRMGPDFDIEVLEVMTRDVITGMPQDDVNTVAYTMTE